MIKTTSEKLVYIINIAFVIIILLFSIPKSFEAGDKVTIIYLGWFFMFAYFLVLSVLYFRSRKNRSKKYWLWFDIVSILPGIYLIPAFIMHIIHYEVGDLLANTFIFGSALWLIVTIYNSLKKER